jgi:hypothetical protein
MQAVHFRVQCEDGRLHCPKIIEHHSSFVFALNVLGHSSMICHHSGFLVRFPVNGEFLYVSVLKALWFSDFPYNQRLFHLPVIKPQRKTVNLSLQSFPPQHFSPLKQFCLVMHEKVVSSPFVISFGSYPSIIEGSLATHFVTASSPSQNSLQA